MPSHQPLSRDLSEPRPVFAIHSLFFGPDGLRAGWSIALYLAIAFGIASGTVFVLKSTGVLHHAAPNEANTKLQALRELSAVGAEVLAVLGAAFAMSRLERRSFSRYGLGTPRGFGKQIAGGLFCGFAFFALLVAVLVATHALQFTGTILHGQEACIWGAMWALAFTGVSFFEEYLARGFLQFTLSRGFSKSTVRPCSDITQVSAPAFWGAAAILSTLFAAAHYGNAGESMTGLVSAGLFALLLAYSLRLTGSLWWAISAHTSWNWAQEFFFGLPNSGSTSPHRFLNAQLRGPVMLSGGATGAEGSLVMIPVLMLMALVVLFTLRLAPDDPRHEPADLEVESLAVATPEVSAAELCY